MALQVKDLLSSALGGTLEGVQELHLSHKGLEDVRALASSPNVVNLNISFNKLVSLTGLEVLSHLQLLDLSHNSIKSLKPLSSLSGLQVLKVSHNKISQVVSLGNCSSLRELWVQHNQIASHALLLPIITLPSLTTLFLSPNPLCDILKSDYRAAVVHTLPSLQGLDGQSISDSDRAAAADWGTRQAQQQAADPAVEDSNTPDPAASAPGLPGLSSRAAAVPKSGLPGSPRRGVTLTKGKSTGLKPRKSGETPVGSFDQQRSSIQTPATDSAGVPELPTAQGFDEVAQQLPTFNIDKHGNRLDKPLDPYGTITRKKSTRQDPGVVETVYQTFYGHTSQHQAIIVRSDGSATAQYPSEGIAVSVDPDQTGGRRGGIRLLATYRSTGLAAVMFEADGTGSVQYPNGNLWMSFTAETGKGALYSHAGEVTRAWTSEAEEPIELLLDQHLGFCYQHQQPVVYFACEGQMQCFKQGQNRAEHVWGNAPDSSAPAFLQELADRNRMAAATCCLTEPSAIPRGTTAQPVAGPSVDQLSAITAALTALQSSMTSMLVTPDSADNGTQGNSARAAETASVSD